MNMYDRTAHGANALVCITGCLTATADSATTGGTGMAALLSLREVFKGRTKAPKAIYERTKAALDQALNDAHLTQDDKDKIHYAINEGCPSPERVIALGRNPTAIAHQIALALEKTNANAVLKSTFVTIVSDVLDQALKDPDSANELGPAFQKALLELLEEQRQTANRTEAKVDGLPEQLTTFLAEQGYITKGETGAHVDDLIALAAKFEETTITDPLALVQFLTQKAEEYRSYKTLIDNIDDRIAAVANLKAAAQDAAEKLNFDEVEELLSRVDEVETEIAVSTKEARAGNALLRNRPEEAYKTFTSAAEALAGVDELAATSRRHNYFVQLYNHGMRYGGTGLALSADMIRPAISRLEETDNKADWAAYTQNLANALANQGLRTAGEAGTKLLAEAVAAYRNALTVYTRDAHPVDWAMTIQNLANTLASQGLRTAGEAGTKLLAEAVAAYRDALTVYTRDAHPVDWATTTQNLAIALRNQGTRTAGEAGTKLLAEAVAAYRDALTVSTRDAHPVHWAETTQNLAVALQQQGIRAEGKAGTNLLAEAVAAYHDALTIRTRDAQSAKWAMTQENLALCERARAQHPATTNPDLHWDAALAHVDAALEVYDPEHMSYDYETATALRNAILARR